MKSEDNDIKRQIRSLARDRATQNTLALDAAMDLHWKLVVLAETDPRPAAFKAILKVDEIIMHLNRSALSSEEKQA